MNERLIAVIADSGSGDTRDPAVQSLVLAAVTAILEHGGRVLLCADAAVRLPVLFAAAEYVLPIHVETPEGRAPAPVLLAPFPDDDSLEERLLTDTPQGDRMEGPPRTLVEQLIDAGIAEEVENDERAVSRRSFDDLLRTSQPAAVVVIGHTERAETLQGAAVRYHRHVEASRLVRLDPMSQRNAWPGIDDRLERFRTPPRFEGQPVDDRVRQDDALWRIAMHAAGDAARVLAIEDVIAEILGDLESISPEYERG